MAAVVQATLVSLLLAVAYTSVPPDATPSSAQLATQEPTLKLPTAAGPGVQEVPQLTAQGTTRESSPDQELTNLEPAAGQESQEDPQRPEHGRDVNQDSSEERILSDGEPELEVDPLHTELGVQISEKGIEETSWPELNPEGDVEADNPPAAPDRIPEPIDKIQASRGLTPSGEAGLEIGDEPASERRQPAVQKAAQADPDVTELDVQAQPASRQDHLEPGIGLQPGLRAAGGADVAERRLQSAPSVPQDHEPRELERSDPVSLVSRPVSFTVRVGGSLTLPCRRRSADGARSLAWLHEGRFLVSSGTPVSQDLRYSLLPDAGLRVTNAGPQDNGTFTCKVYGDAGHFQAFAHRVHVLGKARENAQLEAPLEVVTRPGSGVSVVQRGHPATLACLVTGDPSATVVWTKEEGSLPYGETDLHGARLEIGEVDRSHGGTYVCTARSADNRTAVHRLRLEVEFAPEVVSPEPVVYSGEGRHVVLRCHVFAHPPAQVTWLRASGRPLEPDRHVTTSDGERFRLAMRVTTGDLDTYLCVATSPLGVGQASVQLTGRPGQAVVTSPAQGQRSTTYGLAWRVRSLSPLLAYKLLYRKHQVKPGATAKSRPAGAWLEAVIPLEPRPAGAGDVYRHQYTIGRLQPGTWYEALVLAGTRHGWGAPESAFLFRTAPDVDTEAAKTLRSSRHEAGGAGGDSASSMRAGAATFLIAALMALLNI
ncbi:hemicentin-2-like isoform X2 [Pollicipes pollicipes]|uniref:hemicentin-2-like isoform X2 n=1 Tax=Pollicipes pollicipes TaxID=41117 RepID=UPI0018851F24|nr:hemicentin-2-like isoform X2 [Pollicipes pollicipes]